MELRKYELRSTTNHMELAYIYDSIDGDDFEDGVEWCLADEVDKALAAKGQRIAELEAELDKERGDVSEIGTVAYLYGASEARDELRALRARVQQLEAERVSDDVLEWMISKLHKQFIHDDNAPEFDEAVDISDLRRKNKEAGG